VVLLLALIDFLTTYTPGKRMGERRPATPPPSSGGQLHNHALMHDQASRGSSRGLKEKKRKRKKEGKKERKT
jgi:hypothetical protein